MATYQAILRGDHVEWIGKAPDTNGGIAVEITVADHPASDEAARRRQVRDALESLARRGTYAAEIADPVEWQRTVRADRPLPGRED
jgi:hypothetical protein